MQRDVFLDFFKLFLGIFVTVLNAFMLFILNGLREDLREVRAQIYQLLHRPPHEHAPHEHEHHEEPKKHPSKKEQKKESELA